MANTEVIKPISSQRVCSIAGTAIRVASSNSNSQRFTDTAIVQAHPDNVGNIYLGGSDVSSSNGLVLSPGDAMNLGQFLDKKRGAVLDLWNWWVVSSANNDQIRVVRAAQVAESEI